MTSAPPKLPAIEGYSPLEAKVVRFDDLAAARSDIADAEARLKEVQSLIQKLKNRNEAEAMIHSTTLESGSPETDVEARMSQSQILDEKNRDLTRKNKRNDADIQSIVDSVHSFEAATQEIKKKLENNYGSINSKDVAHIQSCEHKIIGHRPDANSISAGVQRLAAVNEKIEHEKAKRRNSGTNDGAADGDGDDDDDDDDDTDAALLPPAVQSSLDKEKNLIEAIDMIQPKIDHAPRTITMEDANLLLSRDARAHGRTVEGSVTAYVQSIAATNDDIGI